MRLYPPAGPNQMKTITLKTTHHTESLLKKACFQPLSEEKWAHPFWILLAQHVEKCYTNLTQPQKQTAIDFIGSTLSL